MKFPWKKILGGAVAGLKVAALVDPQLGAAVGIIESIQHISPDKPGAEKAQDFETIADSAIDLTPFTDEQKAELRRSLSSWKDTYVAVRNAETAAETAVRTEEKARAEFIALRDSFKPAAVKG